MCATIQNKMKKILQTKTTYGKTYEETDRDLLPEVYGDSFVRAECRMLSIGKSLCLYPGHNNEFVPITIQRDFEDKATLGNVPLNEIGIIELDRPGSETTQVAMWPCDKAWVNNGPRGHKYDVDETTGEVLN